MVRSAGSMRSTRTTKPSSPKTRRANAPTAAVATSKEFITPAATLTTTFFPKPHVPRVQFDVQAGEGPDAAHRSHQPQDGRHTQKSLLQLRRRGLRRSEERRVG